MLKGRGKDVRWRERERASPLLCAVQPENQIISLEATKRRFQRERKPLETTLVSQMPDPNSRVFFARLRMDFFSLSIYLSIYLASYPSLPLLFLFMVSKARDILNRLHFCFVNSSVNKETFPGSACCCNR